MRLENLSRTAFVGLTAGCAVLGAAVGISLVPHLPGGAAQASDAQIESKPPSYGGYETNANGLTFGSAVEEATVGQLPDLIAVEMADGTVAYIYQRDLVAAQGETPSSPTQAIAQQQERLDKARERGQRGIQAFQADGVTPAGLWYGFSPAVGTVEESVSDR